MELIRLGTGYNASVSMEIAAILVPIEFMQKKVYRVLGISNPIAMDRFCDVLQNPY